MSLGPPELYSKTVSKQINKTFFHRNGKGRITEDILTSDWVIIEDIHI
jgi:hypothetical protein